jgi:CRISPR-associated protein Csb2
MNLRFPGGRYHATPWGHHVNEGLIEWPPSPWRLLRALIASGFSSQEWVEIPSVARQLVYKLAQELPSYRLPQASAAHSRHFMPIGTLAKGREQTTLVFDTWANVGNGNLLIDWPSPLNEEESTLLKQLAARLGYLGRSESWVEAEVIVNSEASIAEFNAFPVREGTHPGQAYEQISLMAAIPSEDYRSWQQQTTTPILEGTQPPVSTRKPTAKQFAKLGAQRAQAIAAYPPDLLACLTKDTSWWKQHGWSQPPGSQRVLYWRRADSLQVGAPPPSRRVSVRPVTTMLLALTTPSGNKFALPPCSRTLPQAELFHRTVVGRAGKGGSIHCPALTGKDEQGHPLRQNHVHAHTLPVDLDGDGHLDHIIIYTPMGLCGAAQNAIRSMRKTWAKGGVGDIQVAVAGHGDVAMLRQLPPPLQKQVEQLLGPDGGARVWESVTPFVPPRFVKPRGRNTLYGQVSAELSSRRLPDVQSVQVDMELTRELRHYIRRRSRGGVPPFADIGYGLRLVFSEPVTGPLVLGYASHYGIGLFRCTGNG